MNKEINLINQPVEQHLASDDQVQKSTRLTVIILVIFFSFALAVFAYGIYLQTNKQKLDNVVSEKEQSINAMKENEYLYRVYKSKVTVANSILSGRNDLVPILEFVENTTAMIEKTTPNGIELRSLAVPNLTTIVIQVMAKDSNLLDQFIALLVNNDSHKYFQKIHLDNLTRNTDKGYEFALTFMLNEIAKKAE